MSTRFLHLQIASRLLVATGLLPVLLPASVAAESSKPAALSGQSVPSQPGPLPFVVPGQGTGSGHRIQIGPEDQAIPVVVVRGSPYEMGWHLGHLTRTEMHTFLPPAVAAITGQLGVSVEVLREAWARSAAHGDDRVEQELAGLADGSGLPLALLQAVHAIPLLMPYSCSSIAAWGDATEDGHLYQTRNLDWSLAVGAHDFPVLTVYLPKEGIPHVVPSFAGMIGAHTGINARGIVLSEMGDASAKEAPYAVHAAHFTVVFRTLLYDATSLSSALDIFKGQTHTKRYHYVFGDGRTELRAVKIRAHTPLPADQWLRIWSDNDPDDEFFPNVLSCVVYNDEGRGAFPTLRQDHGRLNAARLIHLANRIPIKGGNVFNAVYDATALQLWVAYARGQQEAYLRPYTHIDLARLDADGDGQPDLPSIVHP